MKKHPAGKGSFLCSALALMLGAVFPGVAQSAPPEIEGTYRLVSREMADGTSKGPPDAMGLLTYTKEHRNFNVVWRDESGKFFSYSVVSTYSLTEASYTETVLFSVLNDQIGGKEIAYDLSGPSQTVPVRSEDSRLIFKLPFDPVTVTFQGDTLIAEGDGFTDYWERVR